MSINTVFNADLLPEVQEFLNKKTHGAMIEGEEVMASDGGTFDTHDPGSGEKLATVANLTGKDVERAVAAAFYARPDRTCEQPRRPRRHRARHVEGR